MAAEGITGHRAIRPQLPIVLGVETGCSGGSTYRLSFGPGDGRTGRYSRRADHGAERPAPTADAASSGDTRVAGESAFITTSAFGMQCYRAYDADDLPASGRSQGASLISPNLDPFPGVLEDVFVTWPR